MSRGGCRGVRGVELFVYGTYFVVNTQKVSAFNELG